MRRPTAVAGDNGNGSNSGSYRDLDRKIDNVVDKVDQDLVRFRGEIREDFQNHQARSEANFQNFQTNIASQIRNALGSPKSPQVVPLIGTAIGIITVLGSVIGFIYSDLNASIDKTDKSATKALEKLANAQATELTLRAASEQRIYDVITRVNENVWHKDAQAEFERREDEERELQFTALKDSVTVLAGGVTRLAAEIVPRAEHDRQWANDKEMIGRVEASMTQSINRVLEHLNKFEDRSALKFDTLDHDTHPYGTADVFKDLGSRVQNLQDQLLRFLVPGPSATAPAAPKVGGQD